MKNTKSELRKIIHKAVWQNYKFILQHLWSRYLLIQPSHFCLLSFALANPITSRSFPCCPWSSQILSHQDPPDLFFMEIDISWLIWKWSVISKNILDLKYVLILQHLIWLSMQSKFHFSFYSVDLFAIQWFTGSFQPSLIDN